MDRLQQTPLHALHLELGARMVPFAGYDLPVHYAPGVMAEHLHTRAGAGLFDVSHMGQVRLSGADPAAALEALVPVDVIGLKPSRQRYGLFTDRTGGILDDLMIANLGDHLLLVVNAACKAADTALLRAGLPGIEVTPIEDRALLALQGPAAEAVLDPMVPGVAAMRFMDVARFGDLWISRSGYTGEDGYEISLPADQTETFARQLLAHSDVEPIGLGARDSLRLEAGLCLYGADLDPATTPEHGRARLGDPEDPAGRRRAGRRVPRGRHGPGRTRDRRRPQPGRPPARRARADAGRHPAVRVRGGRSAGRHRDVGRLRPVDRPAACHGIRRYHMFSRRHRSLGRGARQAASRHGGGDAVSSPVLQALRP